MLKEICIYICAGCTEVWLKVESRHMQAIKCLAGETSLDIVCMPHDCLPARSDTQSRRPKKPKAVP